MNTVLTENRYKKSPETFTSAGGDMHGIVAIAGLDLPPGLALWRVSLDELRGEWDRFHSWLSPDEQERARRFHFERDRDRFILRRGSLRWILARYLDTDPGACGFAYGSAGKPVLAGNHAERVRFNVSHSDGLAVVAVSAHHEVGVDVERVRLVLEAGAILERHFSDETVARWRGLSVDQQPEAFLRSWVRHEAEVKRSGQGLAGIREEHGADSADGQVRVFVPASGYVGALAWGGSEQVGKWERETRISRMGDEELRKLL